MTGVKLGDRVAFIGAADPGRTAAIAAKVGLSGRAAAAVPDEQALARVNTAAAGAGVLVDADIGDARTNALHLSFNVVRPVRLEQGRASRDPQREHRGFAVGRHGDQGAGKICCQGNSTDLLLVEGPWPVKLDRQKARGRAAVDG